MRATPLAIYVFLCFAWVQETPAAIITAYTDSATDLEWADMTTTVGLSWNDVNAVCNPSCSGTLNSMDATGWTWADSSMIGSLWQNITGEPGTSDLEHVEPFGSPEGDAMLAAFDPTLVQVDSVAIIGYVSDVVAGSVSFFRIGPTILNEDLWQGIGIGLPTSPRQDAGVWLYRTAVHIPEPGTLLLYGTVLGLVAHRRRRKASF